MKCPSCQMDNSSDSRFCKQCATPLPAGTSGALGSADASPTRTISHALRELTAGSTFAGRYQIVEELGHGGMGRVYKAVDTQVNERIALKLLMPEISADSEMIERFRNELKLARRIAHRNICRMFDLGESEGTRFITMEYVSGQDLKIVIRMTGSLAVGTILSVGRQIADGLAEAHGLGIVHRDLKSQNVMIDTAGRAKIMDFGIARSVREKGVTGPGVMIGTPEYMSPEQCEARDADARSDIYSLGIILYEMATGRVPFEGETALSVAMKQKGEKPKDPRQLNPNVSDDIAAIILRCLEKDPAKRFASAVDLRAELERVEKGLPTTERVAAATQHRPFTSKEITVKFTLRKAILPAAATLVIVGAIVAWQLVRLNKGRTTPAPPAGKPSLAIINFENISGDPALDDWRTGLPELLGTDLSQSKFLTVLSGETTFGILKKLGLSEAKKYSAEDLAKVATAGKVEYVLSGGIMKAGPKIIITARLQRPGKGEVIETKKVECAGEGEIPARVDELTRMVKAGLNLSPQQIAGDIDKSVGEISTPSAEAWAYYVEARRYHFRNEPGKAIPLLRKALALDPEFIMANRALGAAYRNSGDFPEWRKYTAKTLELIQKHPERVSERDRYFFEQDYWWGQSEKDWSKSLEAGRKLLALYPDDPSSNYDMAIIYQGMEDWDTAVKYFETCSSLKYRFESSYAALAAVYRAKNEPAKAQEVLEKYLREIENTASGHRSLAFYHLDQNRPDLASRELEIAETLAPDDWGNRSLRGDILFFQGDLAAAEAEYRALFRFKSLNATYDACLGLVGVFLVEGRYEDYQKVLVPSIEQSRRSGAREAEWTGRFYTAYFYLKAGRPDIALEECRKAYAVDGGRRDLECKRRTLQLRGFIELALKRTGEAEKTAGELKALIETGLNKKAIRLYDHLMGAIELERGEMAKAVATLEQAVSELPYGPFEKDAWFLDSLASAYVRAGDLEKARAEYEKITTLTNGRFFYGDIYARSFYQLGQIHEKLGDKAKARENYQRFLDLWKDADPGFGGVSDAKARLAGLSYR